MSDYTNYMSVNKAKGFNLTRPQIVAQIEVRTRMLVEGKADEWAQMMRDEIKELTDFIYAQWTKENL